MPPSPYSREMADGDKPHGTARSSDSAASTRSYHSSDSNSPKLPPGSMGVQSWGAPGSSYDMDVPSAEKRVSSMGMGSMHKPSSPNSMDSKLQSQRLCDMEKDLEKVLLVTEVLEPPFTLFALEPGRLLDGRISAMSEAMARTSWASIFYTSTPLTAGLSKPVFQGMISMIGLWFLLMAGFSTVPKPGQPSIVQPLCQASAFRFVPLELRDGNRDMTSPGIYSFGLTLDGVPLEDYVMEKATFYKVGKEARLFFNYTVKFNGWYIVSDVGDPAKDAVSFELLSWDPTAAGREIETIQDIDYRKDRLNPAPQDNRRLFGRYQTLAASSSAAADGGATDGVADAEAEARSRREMMTVQEVFNLDDGWVRVGASGWFFMGSLDISGKHTDRLLNMPRMRRRRVIFDYGVRWEAVMNDLVLWVLCGCGTIGAAVAGRMHHERFGKKLMGSMFLLLACSMMSKLGFLCSIQHFDYAVTIAMFALGVLAAAYVFLVREDALLGAMVMGGWYFLAVAIFDAIYSGIGGMLWILSFSFLFCLLTGFGAWGVYLRRRHVKDAWQLIDPDRQVYDTIWNKLVASPGAPEALQLLEDQAVRVCDSIDGSVVRQLNRQRLERSEGMKRRMFSCQSMLPPIREPGELHGGGLMFRGRLSEERETKVTSWGSSLHLSIGNRVTDSSHDEEALKGTDSLKGTRVEMLQKTDSVPHVLGPEYLHYTTIKGTVDPTNPISSLDQLFLQASGTSPMLRGLVLKWASKSDGLLQFRRPAMSLELSEESEATKTYVDRFETWKNAHSCRINVSAPEGGGVRWAKIKAPERASEKVLRSYKGDVSRLLDICRQSIVFRDVAGMTACLAAIIDDPEVRVVRVKNRMCSSYQSCQSGGYRDVAINFRIVSESAMRFGVDTHVCEVQLLLLDFATVKSDAGHKRYVQFRNTKGE